MKTVEILRNKWQNSDYNEKLRNTLKSEGIPFIEIKHEEGKALQVPKDKVLHAKAVINSISWCLDLEFCKKLIIK